MCFLCPREDVFCPNSPLSWLRSLLTYLWKGILGGLAVVFPISVYVCVFVYDFSLLITLFKVYVKDFHFLYIYDSRDNETFKDIFIIVLLGKKSLLIDVITFFCIVFFGITNNLILKREEICFIPTTTKVHVFKLCLETSVQKYLWKYFHYLAEIPPPVEQSVKIDSSMISDN